MLSAPSPLLQTPAAPSLPWLQWLTGAASRQIMTSTILTATGDGTKKLIGCRFRRCWSALLWSATQTHLFFFFLIFILHTCNNWESFTNIKKYFMYYVLFSNKITLLFRKKSNRIKQQKCRLLLLLQSDVWKNSLCCRMKRTGIGFLGFVFKTCQNWPKRCDPY